MPFARPTLSDLRAQVAADITAGVPGADGLLRFANLRVLGDTNAGLSNLHFGYLDYIAKQATPYTATDEYLEAWAALKRIYRLAATASSGSVTYIGSGTVTIDAGTPVVRGDGASFTTQASATLVNGSVTVPILADTPGSAGNSDQGTQLTLGTAIAGIQSTGVAATPLTGGTDQELDESLRSRMFEAFQTVPEGGSGSDYVTWARAVAGVTRAWCNPNGFGSGTVVVYVMLDAANSAHQGFPQGRDGLSVLDNRITASTVAQGDQLTIANALYSQQPVTAMVYVCAPEPNTIDFIISGLSGASTATQAAIAAAITETFLDNGSPIAGSLVELSDIESAIASISGTSGFVIVSPVGNLINQTGMLPVLGTVTYT